MGWLTSVPILVLVTTILDATHGTDEYLLPSNLVPYHYDLTVLYDVDPSTNFSYYGNVDIFVTCTKPTNKVILHGQSFDLYKEKISVRSDKGDFVVQKATINDTYNFLTLDLDRNLDLDTNYTVSIPFYGNLKSGLNGVYISTYNNKQDGGKEYLISTHFEAISARKGWPCFDEPIYKATFTVTIGHPIDFTAISNMPVHNSTGENLLEPIWKWTEIQERFKKDQGLFVWDTFAKSVPMSTYLLAYVVSRFGHVDSHDESSKTKFSIWARTDAIDQTAYAASIGPKVLSYFEEWFNVTYPLPKQDMIAIPDFGAGAMENWGLITYRETALLYDENESSFRNKERVASVVAHELAHQWFGNLVTMKWWSDLWLNEGFATYAGARGVAQIEPKWKHNDYEAVWNMRSVFSLDALESSHPVSVPINDPKRIEELFDEISYKKGSHLIRMMVMFLGEDTFRKAINSYLVKYSYSNAEQDDLWRELTEASSGSDVLPNDVTVKDVMDTWTTKTGYPLLTVTRDYTDKSFTVQQKRYFSLGGLSETSATSWWIPLKISSQSEKEDDKPKSVKWLSNKQGIETPQRFEDGPESDEWLLFNVDIIALYRVNYDKKNWQYLTDVLNSDNFNSIPTLSRVQLLTDAFALAWTNVVDYKMALQLGNYLYRETEFYPLETGLSELSKIQDVLLRTPDYGAFQKFVRKLITKTYEKHGGLHTKKILNGDDLISVKMQVLVSSWACSMRVPGCEENAIELFRQWMDIDDPDTNNPIPLDLRGTVYCVGARRGSVHEWRFLFERYRSSNVAAARSAAMLALACTNEVWLLRQYLEWSIGSGTEVRRQDAGLVISTIANKPIGYYLVKEFLYHRIDDILKAFNGQTRALGGIIKSVVGQFTTQHELDEFISWSDINSKVMGEIRVALSQAIERAKVNIAWLQLNRESVVQLMREFSGQ